MESDVIKSLVMSVLRGEKDFSHLFNLLEPAIQYPTGLDSETAMALALLLGEVEQQANINDQLYTLRNDQGPPAFALSEAGKVLGHNLAAGSLFEAVPGQPLLQLDIRPSDFVEFKHRVIGSGGTSILRIYPKTQHNVPVIFLGQYQAEHQVFLLRAIEGCWSTSIDVALKEVFDLTAAERDILACLAKGMSSHQISLYRQSQIGTVRQQIKSLLNKMGASSQVQAAALASALASQSQTISAHSGSDVWLHQPSIPQTGINPAKSVNEWEQYELIRDTRRIGWRRYGEKGGHPILLMHGAYFGAGDFAPDRFLAAQAGMDVVIVERPGYGQTQPPMPEEFILDTHVKDCLEVLNLLGWGSVWIQSQDYGFVSALMLANRYPERVRGLLAISPVPLYRADSDLSAIPYQQRIFIWAAQHAFWMIPLLLRLGHVKARKLGPLHWMDMVFDSNPDEIKVFNTPDGKEVSAGAYHFNLCQNSKGHELDMNATITRDWTELLQGTQIPIQAIAGHRNTTFSIDAVRALRDINPAFSLHEIEAASLTLALTHTKACHSALLALVEQYDGNLEPSLTCVAS